MQLTILSPKQANTPKNKTLLHHIPWKGGTYLEAELEKPKNTILKLIFLMDGPVIIGVTALKTRDILKVSSLTPFISTVFVNEAFRKRGYSKILVKAAETEAARLGHNTRYIVSQHVGLYEKNGYKKTSATDIFNRSMSIYSKQI